MLEIIKEILLDDAGVTGLVGTDIFTNHDTPEATLPAVTMEIYSQSELNSSGSTPANRYQLKVYAMRSSIPEANNLGQLVSAALDGRSGSYTDDSGTSYDLLSISVNDYDLTSEGFSNAAAAEMDVAVTVIADSSSASTEGRTTQQDADTGWYAVNTSYYNFDGTSGDTVSVPADTWTTLPNTAGNAIFDRRPTGIKSGGNPQYDTATSTWSCEGLNSQSSATIRTLVIADPDTDESSMDIRLAFTANNGNSISPAFTFNIEDQLVNFDVGADRDYQATSEITFFVGETLAELSDGDYGSFQIQVRSDVDVEVEVLNFTLYITL